MLYFFTDPLLRGPIVGALLISFVTSLLGVTLFVQRRSLLAETLSHATYPGVLLGATIALFLPTSTFTFPLIIVGGVTTALLALGLMQLMTKRFAISLDASFTFILSTFFAFGILLASYLQSGHPLVFQTIRSYLYGQTATLTDGDILLYALFSLLVLTLLALLYKESLVLFFDRNLSSFSLSYHNLLSLLFLLLTAVCIIFAMRSVGVILISGLLIAPALAARQYTNRLSILFMLSGLFGALSALIGGLASHLLSLKSGLSLPTGPMIVIAAQTIAFGSLLFAPKRGLIVRYVRICLFQFKCCQENLLKSLWRNKEHSFATLRASMGLTRIYLYLHLFICKSKGLVANYKLTERGERIGAKIVRLHRLWELYLVENLGMPKKEVHRSAEEMEHILTPALEDKLTAQLKNPLFDPHDQPIPYQKRGDLYG